MEKKFTGDIYEDSIIKWGEIGQLDQTVEEMAELTCAISKYKRQFNDSLLDYQKENLMEHLYEEIVDVKLMLEELEYMFGKENIDKMYGKKVDKLKLELYGKDYKNMKFWQNKKSNFLWFGFFICGAFYV